MAPVAADPCPALVAVTRPCVAPDALPRPVVIATLRAPAVANEWLPLTVAWLALPAVTMLWAPPGTLPRPVVIPVLRAPAVVNEWVAPLGALPRPVAMLELRAEAVRKLPPVIAWLVLPAVTIAAEARGAADLAGGLVWTRVAGGIAGPGPCTPPEAVVACPPLPGPPLAPGGELPDADKLPPVPVVAVLAAAPDGPLGPVVDGPVGLPLPVGPGPEFCCGLCASSGSDRRATSRSGVLLS